MSWHVKTQGFSGPFDLLLQLVSRQKVAIGSISVSEVADQYLAEVQRMGEMDLDVASDFVLVASTLLEMKAAALVPAGQDELKRARQASDDFEDEDLADLSPDDAREVLIARLIAYKQFRNAAGALGARLESESRMFARSVGPDPEFMDLMPDYLEGISLRSLAVICADLDSRRETFLLESEHIAPRRLPIALTVSSVDRLARARGHLTFSELVEGSNDPEVVVSNFLAILDLFKRGKLLVSQRELFGEIELEHVEGATPYEMDASVIGELEEMGEGELVEELRETDGIGFADDEERDDA